MPRSLVAASLLFAVAAFGCTSKARVGDPSSSRGNGTGGGNSANSVTVDQEFELSPGQSALIGPEPLKITFEAVTADSRCPEGVQCAWAGDAVVKLMVATGTQSPVSYELHTNTGYPTKVVHGAYQIRLVAVAPPTRPGVTIDPSAYVVTLLVTRP